MARGEKQLLDYMTANGGVITRSEALALGMTSSSLARRLESGHIIRVGRGTYALPGMLTGERSILRAATAALGAVASHESAARLHGLDGLDPRRLAVTVPVRRTHFFPDVTVHQSTDLTPEQVTEVLAIPVTDPIRTILDLAAVLPETLLAPILDQSIRKKLTIYEAISDHLEAIARKGKPGVRKLRKLLEVRLGANFVSDSTLEPRLLRVLGEAGLPLPKTQFRPEWLKEMSGRVDLCHIDERIVIEGDSQRWHGTPEAFQADRVRDNLAQLAGWLILRFTWEDITKRPGYVVDTVATAISVRRNSHI